MACGCPRKRKNLDYVRELAINFAKVNNEEVQIYEEKVYDLENEQILYNNEQILYNFEPLNETRENIIEYIKPWQVKE